MIVDLVRQAAANKASDLHISPGAPPVLRIAGQLVFTAGSILTGQDTWLIFLEMATPAQQETFVKKGEVDFAYQTAEGCCCRVNAFRCAGVPVLALRLIARQVPVLEHLGFSGVLEGLCRKPHGMIIVCGAAGCGKTTTMAAMIDYMNRNRQGHIITLEDPPEYIHVHKSCLVNQRDVYADSSSFAAALKAALREDPDIIMVGEMRDLETISTALTAACTGHLVLATLHTSSAAEAVDRMIAVFSPVRQEQVKIQVAAALQGIICQTLWRRQDGLGMVAAQEILLTNTAVRNIIREGRTPQLPSVIQSCRKDGMQTMDMSIEALAVAGIVAAEDVAAYRNIYCDTLTKHL